MSTFPVCRTAETPADVIDRFLSATYAESEDLAPGTGPALVVLGDENVEEALATKTTSPGSSTELPPSPFIGMPIADVAERMTASGNEFFVIMDAQSAKDDTVLLVKTEGDDDDNAAKVPTVRATFASSQSVLIGLHMRSQGFREVQYVAAGAPDGVYGPERSGRPQQGEPAPRKRLGA